MLSFVDIGAIRPVRVVADTANGMGGLVVPAVLERIPSVELEVMYGELDGTFPNHPADPLQPANQRDLRHRVRAGGFDVGLAFDGDADRVFVVDELGTGLSGSTTTAILATAVLRSEPGATILHNLICSRAVPEVIREHGGVPVRTKVGHSFIKQVMAETGAVFGGEHSAHYYFARNYRADSGLIATVMLLGEHSRAGQELSIVRKPFERYSQSGEINTTVADVGAVLAAVSAADDRAPPGRARRADRRLRLVVVQPAPVEHRAVAPAEPGSRDPRRLRRPRRRAAGADHERLKGTWMIDAALLQILACPEDKGPLYYLADEGEGVLFNPRLRRVYEIRDDIPIMLIDEAHERRRGRGGRLQARIDDEKIPAHLPGLSASLSLPRRADPIGASWPRPVSFTTP